MDVLQRCVFDIVRHAQPISTGEIIDQVLLFLPDTQGHEAKRAIEKLVDMGKIEYLVDFKLSCPKSC